MLNVMIALQTNAMVFGFLDRIIEQLDLRRNKVVYQIFADVEPDPDITTVERGTEVMRAFKPDNDHCSWWWITNGCGQSYVALSTNLRSGLRRLAQKFMDIRKRAFRFHCLETRRLNLLRSQQQGTGSGSNSSAVISDKANNRKYPIADYPLTPTAAIVDPALVLTVLGSVAADTDRLDALTHATEVYKQ